MLLNSWEAVQFCIASCITVNDVAKSKIPANVNGSFTVLSVKRLHNMEPRHESGDRTRMLSAVCIPRYEAMKI